MNENLYNKKIIYNKYKRSDDRNSINENNFTLRNFKSSFVLIKCYY